MTAFKTKNGREVFDGGGIQPDIITEKENISNIVVSLFRERLFFDYATEFRFKNDSINKDFIFSESDYLHFINYLSDKEYSYNTKTEEALKSLKKHAKDENYFATSNKEFEALESQLSLNKGDDLLINKQEIIEILTGEIRSRYFYQKGRIEAALNFDMELEKAISILKNQEEYNSILANE